ncbi:MAG: cytochrome c [Gemmatimonadaceae bacterium]|nr:cytochrome c [Gemmatimonadaceae bacterium]
MSAKLTFRSAATALLLPLALTACDPKDWITDFQQQPSVGTWQKFSMDAAKGDSIAFRGMPQGSVPTTGVALAEWEVSYTPSFAAVDSMSRLENPVAADPRSIANGHRLYQVNCAVCHGDLGDGRGKVAEVSGIAFVPPINGAATAARSDGYIFGMLRNGRGLMASFNRIPERERWDVVNYIRGLQGRYQVPTNRTLFPGQASSFSAMSAVAPTMPAAAVKPSTEGTVAKPEKAAAEGEHGGDH